MGMLKIITFSVRGRLFAFPTACVKEVLEVKGNLKKVFYSRGGVLKGLVPFEGNLISVLAAAIVLDVKEVGTDSHVVICKDKELNTGLALNVSGIEGIELIDSSKLKKSSDDESGASVGYLREMRSGNERVVTLLDLKKFASFAKDKIKELDKAS